jgi:hypothetical protein
MIEVIYRTGRTGRGPVSIDLNGDPLDFVREENPYRTAGVRIPMESWSSRLTTGTNRMTITLE